MEIKTIEKELESKMQVRFPDCDPFNHLNNSRYIDYIINAREDHLIRHYDLDIYKVAKETGNSWVVTQTQIAYLSPAVLMEMLTIQTKLISFSEKSLMVEGIMWDENKTRMKAVMWIRFTHLSLRTRTSQQHSKELIHLFSNIVYPLQEKNFEERLKKLAVKKR